MSTPGAVKVVVTGPYAAGKTTLVRTVSEIAVVSTERDVTGGAGDKTATTVAMDFGRITLEPDLVLHLFGTPGQDRFSFMWDVLGEGMLGYVLLVDPTRPDGLEEAAGILRAFRARSAAPYVVAVNRTDTVDDALAERVRAALGTTAPVVACQATDRGSVRDVLLALLESVARTLEPAVR